MRKSFAIGHQEPRQLRGGHVLFLLVAFFAVVFAVNGYFLVRALSTHTGVVAFEPYRKGLAYNERIAAAERQSVLGWSDRIVIGANGAVSVAIAGVGDAPIGGLHITGVLSRPSTAAADRAFRLLEDSAGRYAAMTAPIAPGTWIAAIEARRSPDDADPVYRARRRLWLKP